MSNLKKMFSTDKNIEKEGVILDYGDFKVKIARAGGANKSYQKLFERLTKPHRRAIETETINEKLLGKIMHEVYAKTVVLDWEGVTDDNGDELPFTSETCIEMFQEMPDFYVDIFNQSNKIALFKQEVKETDEKNL